MGQGAGGSKEDFKICDFRICSGFWVPFETLTGSGHLKSSFLPPAHSTAMPTLHAPSGLAGISGVDFIKLGLSKKLLKKLGVGRK